MAMHIEAIVLANSFEDAKDTLVRCLGITNPTVTRVFYGIYISEGSTSVSISQSDFGVIHPNEFTVHIESDTLSIGEVRLTIDNDPNFTNITAYASDQEHIEQAMRNFCSILKGLSDIYKIYTAHKLQESDPSMLKFEDGKIMVKPDIESTGGLLGLFQKAQLNLELHDLLKAVGNTLDGQPEDE